jgi:hypothetical protein
MADSLPPDRLRKGAKCIGERDLGKDLIGLVRLPKWPQITVSALLSKRNRHPAAS